MRKILITEHHQKLIKEAIEIENVKLPDFIVASIKQHKTSLGDHRAFPPESNVRFEEKLFKKRYYELLSSVKKVDGIDGDISKKNLTRRLEQLVVKCKRIERPIREKLEEICYKHVFDMFRIDYDAINVECVITDNIESKQQKTPSPLDDSFFEDISHIENMNEEIMKRRFVNSIVMGASLRMSTNFESVLNKIYSIDHRLPEIYYNIISINEYLSFVTERIPSEDSIGGSVSVDLSNEDVVIKASGIIFPVLVFETIKGVMELLSSHGLPDDRRSAEYIISQADFSLAENWDKRFGVGIWDLLTNSIKPENMDILSGIFVELVSADASEFNKIFREVLSGTKKGKLIIADIVDSLREVKEYGEMSSGRHAEDERDDFFTPEELISDDAVLVETDTASAGDYAYDAPLFLDDETGDHKNLISRSVSDGR